MKDERLNDPRMEYYKYVFKNSERWTGNVSLKGKKVIVYGEQGFGDIIQFSRYIIPLKELGCDISFYVPKSLHRLFQCLDVKLLDKENPEITPHDFHILSLDLPFALQVIDVKQPYLTVNETADLGEKPKNVKRIGIAWEGNPNHSNSINRDCPLKYFKYLDVPEIELYMLQKSVHNPSLLDDAEDLNLNGYPINDFYDTAMLINAMDAVVTVDTSVLHLSGALNKLTYALLSEKYDERWDVHNWYHSGVFIRQKQPNDWPAAFRATLKMMTGQMFKERSFDEDLTNQVLL